MLPKVIHVYVTQDDIDDGTRNSCSTCPVALAAKRALQGAVTCCIDHVSVGVQRIIVFDRPGNGIAKYTYARDVEALIQRYDMTGPMEPFDFVAELSETYEARVN